MGAELNQKLFSAADNLRSKMDACVLQDLSTQYCKEKVHTFAPEIFL